MAAKDTLLTKEDFCKRGKKCNASFSVIVTTTLTSLLLSSLIILCINPSVVVVTGQPAAANSGTRPSNRQGSNTGGQSAARRPVKMSETFKQSLNAFNGKFLSVVTSNKKSDLSSLENVFYSPLSISTALGMVMAGSNGTTRNQILSAFNLDTVGTNDVIESSFEKVILDYTAIKDTNSRILANKLIINNGFSVLDSYRSVIKNNFKAEVSSQSLSDVSIVPAINNWVSEKTKGLISTMIDSPFDAMTQLVLLNAIYFKDDWGKKFDRSHSQQLPFKNIDGTVSTVNMMSKKDKVKFLINENLNYSMIELPYKSIEANPKSRSSSPDAGTGTSMVIILPHETTGLINLLTNESTIRAVNEDAIKNVKKVFKAETEISLPSFELETSYDLKDTLRELGISDLFDGANCDLSGISGAGGSAESKAVPESNLVDTDPKVSNVGNNLHVSSVIHKAKVIVNEEGSEAAAVTQVAIAYRSMPLVEEFIVDHPFMFMIKENDLILFTGIVYKL